MNSACGFVGHATVPLELAGHAVLTDPVLGAEQLHRVVRGWLTHLGHPEPAQEQELVES